MSVTMAEFNSFTAADNGTDTEAGANITIAGEIMGDCGELTVSTATMTGSDGSSYEFNVTDDFLTEGGQNIYQEISRGEDSYTLVVTMQAGDDAESVEHHQARTSAEGYNNYLNDSMTETAVSKEPECFVDAVSIEWVSYEEIDEWRGNILASYKGVVRAEESCTDLKAVLKIKNSTSESNFNST